MESMSLPHTKQPRNRKRTKTFTGCWTCRARKVKCDEVRPHCNVCRSKQLVCDGYGARLQWLPPDPTPLSSGKGQPCSRPAGDSAHPASLRRQMPSEPPRHVLSWNQVDDILSAVDSLSQGWSPARHGDISASMHNFGVFGLRDGGTSAGTRLRSVPSTAESDPGQGDNIKEGQASPDTERLSRVENAAAWQGCNLHLLPAIEWGSHIRDQELRRDIPGWHGDGGGDGDGEQQQNVDQAADSTAAWDRSDTMTYFNGSSDSSVGVGDEMGNRGFLSRADSPEFYAPCAPDTQTSAISSVLMATLPQSRVFSERERYLMYHYMHQVVNLFCVIDNVKSPWKTIHLPRAMQCAGEMSVLGSTTKAGAALRNALLSVSAFFVSNKHGAGCRDYEARRWSAIASRYRCDAIGLLKQSVEHDLHGYSRPKYKEVLATTLSMITINVMSGDTSTCRVHLDGARQLIEHMSQRKVRYSSKARILHRIYLYLRIMYESTAPREYSGTSSRFSPLLSSSRAASTLSARDDIDGDEEDAPRFTSPREHLSSSSWLFDDLTPFECIYGIPLSLLRLLKATIGVIDRVDMMHEGPGIPPFDQHLSQTCEELEKSILDWPRRPHPVQLSRAQETPESRIIRHQTRAFHNALIIYFSQNVRLLSHRYLRQYIEIILGEIESIERIKAETRLFAAPLFWPAFVGATEAFDALQQDRFRAWYEGIDKYGMAAVRTGIAVIRQVWEQGPRVNGSTKTTWREILRETGDVLMLS